MEEGWHLSPARQVVVVAIFPKRLPPDRRLVRRVDHRLRPELGQVGAPHLDNLYPRTMKKTLMRAVVATRATTMRLGHCGFARSSDDDKRTCSTSLPFQTRTSLQVTNCTVSTTDLLSRMYLLYCPSLSAKADLGLVPRIEPSRQLSRHKLLPTRPSTSL